MIGSTDSTKVEISVKDRDILDEEGDPIWVSLSIDIEIAKMSKTILDLIGDCDSPDIIPLPNDDTDKKTFERVVAYCKQKLAHDSKDQGWKIDFFHPLQPVDLYHLTMAANFLDIPELFDDVTTAVAETFKGKTPEEIRKEWNIKPDLSPEEIEQIKRENEWILDL